MKKFKLLVTSLLAVVGISSCSTTQSSIFDRTDPNSKYVKSVTLDESYLSLDIGVSMKLTPTVTLVDGFDGEYKAFWKTSRPNIVSVTDDGTITTLAAGTASINYVAGLKMASCTVVVHGGSENPTHDQDQPEALIVTINASSYTMAKGSTYYLTASASDGSPVTWTSSDESKATVVDGLVTAISAGKVDIIATAGTASAKCSITVTDPDVPIDPGTDPEDEDDEKVCTVYFFIDYNNIDEKNPLASFKWYENIPISQSGQVPADPTSADAKDPAFPNFIGWSSHTIIDSKDDLWDMENDVVGSSHFFYLYGVWSDVTREAFVR